jgi:hypothetical protein
LFIAGDFNGILMNGSVSRIRRGRFVNGAASAIRIRAEGGDNSQLIDDVLMGAQLPQICSAGIRVRNSSALIISNTSVIQQGIGLLVDPYSNTTVSGGDSGSVASLVVNNCFFDNSSGNAIKIGPTGNANVIRCRFNAIWASSSASDGINITNGGSGTLSGIHFVIPHVVLNTSAGMTTGGVVSDVAVIGGEFCQNGYGFYLNSGLSKITIIGATIGAGAGLTGNTNQGIVLASGVTAINISNNYVTGNGTPILDNSGAVAKNIVNNPGINPIANTAITVTASPFTYTNNTGAPMNVFVSGGTVSNVTNTGVRVSTATDISTVLAPGNSVVITYTVAPIMQYSGL